MDHVWIRYGSGASRARVGHESDMRQECARRETGSAMGKKKRGPSQGTSLKKTVVLLTVKLIGSVKVIVAVALLSSQWFYSQPCRQVAG